MNRSSWPAGTPETKPYFDEAKRRNTEWHDQRRLASTPFWGVAKPVLVFDGGAGDPQWRLRSRKQFWSDAPAVSFEALKPDGGFMSTRQPCEHHLNMMSEAARTPQDDTLRDAITALVGAYERRSEAVYRHPVLHTLHRLQMYAGSLTLKCDQAGKALTVGYATGAQAGQTPRAILQVADFNCYIDFFKSVREHLDAADAPLTAEDTAEIIDSLKSITRYFRDLSLSLADITDKLATKSKTYAGRPNKLRERLTDLVDDGLQKLTPEVPEAQLQQFLRAFTYAMRSFFGAGPDAGVDNLGQLIDKTVTRLVGMRRDGKDPLFDLFAHLTRRILDAGEGHLIAPLGTLLRIPHFQSHLQTLAAPKRLTTLQSTIHQLLRDPRAALWRAGAALLVSRPTDVFCDSLREVMVVSAPGALAPTKVNYVFVLLNKALGGTSEGIAAKQVKERYRAFLAHLAQTNSLHVLTTVGATRQDRALTAANLQALYKFSAQDPALLNAFFSNAGFKAGEHFGFDGSSMLRDTEAMLRRSRANPVHDGEGFAAQLDTLAEDYALGLPALRGLVLRSLGERSAPGMLAAAGGDFPQLRPVEDWLRESVFPTYYSLMRMVLGCYPLAWQEETFASPHLLVDKLVMTSTGRLLIVGFDGHQLVLDDILGLDGGYVAAPPDPTQKYFTACDVHALFQKGDALMGDADVKRSVAFLTHHFHDFRTLALDVGKVERMRALLTKMQARLQLEATVPSETYDTEGNRNLERRGFQARLDALDGFLNSVSAFPQAYLDAEAKRRFFRDGAMTCHGRKFLLGHEHAEASEINMQQDAIADRLFDVIHGAVAKVVDTSTDTAALCDALSGLKPIMQREIDFRSFNTPLMVDAFNKRHREKTDKRSAFQLEVAPTEALRESLYDDSHTALKRRNIEYIMPNQALAAALCRHADLQDRNVLLKMGTGQGKSFVIAATALSEAARLNAGEFVVVLTGYDHLACGDHETGREFFAARGVESACISQLSDLDRLASDTKIIYADTKTLQRVAQDAIKYQISVMVDPEKFPPKPWQIAFLQQLYAGKHRFILDEYDLVLNDLDFSGGVVMPFGVGLVNAGFVAENRAYAPTLAKSPQPVRVTLQSGRDKADGQGFSTVSHPYIFSQTGEPVYQMRPGALRVAKLLAGASRIIGLSGSADGDTLNQVLELSHLSADYFELPSSRDPDAFGTRIVHGKEDLQDVPGIWCTKKEAFPAGAKADYIASIVSDVQAVREPRAVAGAEAERIERPVLIFVDPDDRDLLNSLHAALSEVVPRDKLHKKLETRDIKGARLQEIGLAGHVTLTSIVCGRGADIQVSPKVPDSMHVVLATQIATDRLRTQVIGRTGRMGRDGSYAEITVDPSPGASAVGRPDARATESLLHDITCDIVQHMSRGCDGNFVLKWLLLASELAWGGVETFHARRAEFKVTP